MTIQVSILVWTIICFILLMLILHHWLFKPVLDVMDKRRARIENAAAKAAREAQLAKEHEQKMLAQKEAYAKEQKAQLKAQAEKIQSDSKKAIVEARHARLNEMDEYRAKIDREEEQILAAVGAHSKSFAALFASRLISK